MSEDPNQLPGEPDASGPQETPASAPQAQPETPQPAVSSAPQEPANAPQPSEQVQYPPLPEVYMQSATPAPVAQPQYPPAPEAYAQPQPASQGPYGAPSTPGTAYGTPPTNFGAPQAGYPLPPVGYGAPGFPSPPAYGYGYAQQPQPPQAQPLPLGQAIRELPGQYKKILFKPGARTFAAEQGKAEWGIIWTQLLFLVLLQVLVVIPLILFGSTSSSNAATPSGLPPDFFSTVLQFESVILVVLTPAIFFAGVGIQYLFAKMFKGQGLFRQQAYNQLLFQVPLAVVTTALSLIVSPLTRQMSSLFIFSASASQAPMFSPGVLVALLLLDVISGAVGIYSIVLNIFSIMAVHRMSGGKASGTVLIPYGLLIGLLALAFCGLVFAGILLAAGASH